MIWNNLWNSVYDGCKTAHFKWLKLFWCITSTTHRYSHECCSDIDIVQANSFAVWRKNKIICHLLWTHTLSFTMSSLPTNPYLLLHLLLQSAHRLKWSDITVRSSNMQNVFSPSGYQNHFISVFSSSVISFIFCTFLHASLHLFPRMCSLCSQDFNSVEGLSLSNSSDWMTQQGGIYIWLEWVSEMNNTLSQFELFISTK